MTDDEDDDNEDGDPGHAHLSLPQDVVPGAPQRNYCLQSEGIIETSAPSFDMCSLL